MKLLIDENISFRLIAHIASAFPNTQHVKDLGLIHANDTTIFKKARTIGFDAIITMDDDFQNILLVQGAPPKIIWMRTGNCSTLFLAQTILNNSELIQSFVDDPNLDSLEIFR
jgi:predicted nuclease of predicted toxin-antitoxin system